MNSHIWLSRLIAGLISIITASTLRERYYLAQQRIELLETGIADISRINAATVNNPLIKGITDRLQ